MIETIYNAFVNSNGVSTDTRKIQINSIFFALKGTNFNANEYVKEAIEKGAKFAVIDEKEFEIPNYTFLVNNVLKTLQDLALYHRKQLGLPIIALTGSNGKTTTKELINAVLSEKYRITATKGNLNNHIGVPLTLLAMTKETEIGIVEMGANHPNEIEFLCEIAQPDYGYITNFGKAHLEGFGNLEGVINAKTELYEYLKINNKIIFVNETDSIQNEKSINQKRITFGKPSSDIPIYFVNLNPFVSVRYNHIVIHSNMIGLYNYHNIAAAIAIGAHFNLPDYSLKQAIESYFPNNNRSQIITKKNVEIILDAYNANPSSMEAALINFKQLNNNKKTVILGDMFELGIYAKDEHQKIVNLLAESDFENIYLIGDNFQNTNTNNNNIIFLKDFKSFKRAFISTNFDNSIILIKASRGMALERIVNLFD